MPGGALAAALSPGSPWLEVAAPSAPFPPPRCRPSSFSRDGDVWGAAAWPPQLRAPRARVARAQATAFVTCLCPAIGHCVPGLKCPPGEHIDPAACQLPKEVTYLADTTFANCREERKNCIAEWAEMRPKPQCVQDCEKFEKECKEGCLRDHGQEDCGCEKEKCMDRTYNCKPTARCVDLYNNGCQTLQADKDVKMKLDYQTRRISVTAVKDQSWAWNAGVRVGSQLVKVDDKMDGKWREVQEGCEKITLADGKDKVDRCEKIATWVLHEGIDWNQQHMVTFMGPMPKGDALKACKALHADERENWRVIPPNLRAPGPDGCYYMGTCGAPEGDKNIPRDTCCAMGASRDKPEDLFVVQCESDKVCKAPETCDEKSEGVCKYQVEDVIEPELLKKEKEKLKAA